MLMMYNMHCPLLVLTFLPLAAISMSLLSPLPVARRRKDDPGLGAHTHRAQ